jgi:hypothetical protein
MRIRRKILVTLIARQIVDLVRSAADAGQRSPFAAEVFPRRFTVDACNAGFSADSNMTPCGIR